MIGTCKLCLTDDVELQKSHLIPASIYRAMRIPTDSANPNPWIVSPKGAVQTSRQIWAHLLCPECEQRFSRNGETWLFRNSLKADDSFPLASILASNTPVATDSNTPNTKLYYAAEIPQIDVTSLTYFAASMFWRASVYPWTTDRRVPVKLGKYGDEFRRFLLGLTGFPKNAALAVVVREKSAIDRFTHEPVTQKVGSLYTHRFPIPGFGFTLLVGQDIPAQYQSPCFVRGYKNPLLVSSMLEESLLRTAVSMVQNVR